MAVELKDLRVKITAHADAVLEAEVRSTGRERSEIVREILHGWALRKIHGASVLQRRLQAEGLPGIDGDWQGLPGASAASVISITDLEQFLRSGEE